jgi:glutamine synthetase
MTTFSERCGLHDAARESALQDTLRAIRESGTELVRLAWCDLHGVLRGKTLVASAVERALREGVGLVSTLMLKDASDHTAYQVFEPGGTGSLSGFGFANNLLLVADPSSFRRLPWAEATGWLQGQAWFEDGTPVHLDTRRILQRALRKLADRSLAMKCGLEVEFHIYRLEGAQPPLAPMQAAWPGPAPEVRMVHPGYNLLNEAWFDMAEEPLRIVQRTAQALGLPLLSLEIELGPSQVEAVFEATDALTAADNMVLFRSAAKQALRRAGYHATFMCRPPFPHIMSSGWHLHQSLVDFGTGRNVFMRDSPAADAPANDARRTLSDLGAHYLAGLLEHARAMALFCVPTANGFARFGPNALAPQSVLWGRDNRGAMLRVIGAPGDAATRIENRIGEPTANPYLYLASQIHAGLDGIERRLAPPPATDAPYGPADRKIPATLEEGIAALQGDEALTAAFGQDFIDHYLRIKRSDLRRWSEAQDKDEFQRREFFGRI